MTSFLTVLLSCCLLLGSQAVADQNRNHRLEEMVDNMIVVKMIEVKEEMESRNEMLRMEMEENVKKLENENDRWEWR